MKKTLLALAIIFIFVNCSVSAAAENKKRIEINAAARMLYLYDDGELVKKYPVCVGKASTPTPLGDYKVIYKVVDPYWINEGKVVPPGPENPLGIRWMGILEDVGIHGNANPESIGTFASGGCIRMYNKDVEELYSIVPLRTPVSVVYDRVEILEDKYSCSKAVIIYPNTYNQKDTKAYSEKLKAAGLDETLAKKAESFISRKSSKAFSVSAGVGVFLNNQFVTCDAINRNSSIFINAQAANEVFGLTAGLVGKYEIPVYENNGKVYVNLNTTVSKLNGRLEYNKTTGNAYISMKMLKVNGVYLSSSCGSFDREYYIDVASLKSLGYDIKEDKVEINLFGRSIIKIMRNKKPSVALDSLMKVCSAEKTINSGLGVIDLKMPTIVKYGDMTYETALIEDRLYIKKDNADSIGYGDNTVISVFNYANTDYIDTAVLLENHTYKANEYFTVIELDKSEL